MQSNYTHKDRENFRRNAAIVTDRAINLKDENGNKNALWDIYEMSIMIKNDMKVTNGDWGFEHIIDPLIYLSAQLKFVKDKNVLNLLVCFYKYGIRDYNAEIYGTKIIDFCNAHGVSYILAIYYLARDNGGFNDGDFYEMPLYLLFKCGYKMRFAKLDEDGRLYYEEPPEEEPFTEETRDKILKYYKDLEDKINENNNGI